MKPKLTLCLPAFILVLTVAVMSGCAAETEKEYSLGDAKRDGYVVFENGDITSGREEWQSFLADTAAGKAAQVKLGFYYMLTDPSQYSPELFEKIKDDYPVLYIKTLSYDGSVYTVDETVDGKEHSSQFTHLAHFTGKPKSASAVFSEYEYYVLVNDLSVTWEQIEAGLFSSRTDAGIPHYVVYSDLIYNSQL